MMKSVSGNWGYGASVAIQHACTLVIAEVFETLRHAS
jgi:hypothetical protein